MYLKNSSELDILVPWMGVEPGTFAAEIYVTATSLGLVVQSQKI
jgi:hypothetical protein